VSCIVPKPSRRTGMSPPITNVPLLVAGRGSVRRESCPVATASVVVLIVHIYTCSFSVSDQIIFNEVPASYQAAVAEGKQVFNAGGLPGIVLLYLLYSCFPLGSRLASIRQKTVEQLCEA
jgi:hypothetical protein